MPHSIPSTINGAMPKALSRDKPKANGSSKMRSNLHRSEDGELHDLICVGFGPSGLSIAVALHDALTEEDSELRGLAPKVRFLERQHKFAWHAGMQVPGAKMQISFLKDMATFRNPQSKFTFLNYLHKNGRLVPFSNLGTFLPQRLEYEDYMRWCAKHFERVVDYNQEVVKIDIGEKSHDTGAVRSWIVTSRDHQTGDVTTLRTKHVVIGAGGQPRIPKTLQFTHPKVIHSSQYITKGPELFADGTKPKTVAVIGGGQSAAEIFHNVPSQFPGAQSILLVRGSALRPSDDSPFVNEVFDPEGVDNFYSQNAARRAEALAQNRATNYGVVRPELIEQIYHELYAYGIKYESQDLWPHRIQFNRDVIGIRENTEPGEPALSLQIRNCSPQATGLKAITTENLSVDLIVIACGYVRDTHATLMKDLRHLMPGGYNEGKTWGVTRDYAVEFQPGTVQPDAGIWLQGCNEKTHGLSDSLLSVLAVRGEQVVESIFSQSDTSDGDSVEMQNGHRDSVVETNGHNGVAEVQEPELNGLKKLQNGHHENEAVIV